MQWIYAISLVHIGTLVLCASSQPMCVDQSSDVLIHARLAALETQVLCQNTRIAELERISEGLNTTVAFTAYAKAVRAYSINAVIQFDGVDTNIGGHYNALTWMFTCPVAGLYFFTVNVLAHNNGKHAYGDIMHNNVAKGRAAAHLSSTHNQGTNSALFDCNPGNIVWIRSGKNDQYFYGHSEKYTTFSGYLVHRYT